MAYIYKITNNLNGKLYIGMTTRTVEERWKEHLDTIYDRASQEPLYRALRKYGTYNFTIEKIEECTNSEVLEREAYWIYHYKTFENGYNATHGGAIAPIKFTRKKVERQPRTDYNKLFYEFRKTLSARKVAQLTGTNPRTVARAVKECSGLEVGEYKKKAKEEDSIADKMIRFICCVQDEVLRE